MGLFSGRNERTESILATAPDQRAHHEVWTREFERLGRDEIVRRLAAISDFRSGRTGPSGFETWNRRIELEIINLAADLARRAARRGD